MKKTPIKSKSVTVEIGATIPTQQYGNIIPRITVEAKDQDTAIKLGMEYIAGLFETYSEKGPLKVNKITSNEKSTSFVELKSFNEDVGVLFDEVNHLYYFNGKKLVSTTESIKKFYKEFDTDGASSNSSKSWGVDQQSIKDMWKSSGDVTSEFGKSVHSMIEHWIKYNKLGKIISEKRKQTDNYVLPKHPILKQILDGFITINTDIQTNESFPEQLITDIKNNHCGTADNILVLDKTNKVCRIQDWKINIESEAISQGMKPLPPYETLPANKVTKYQIQLSDYAHMLEKSGWKVDGLDVFVYEDKWKVYKLDVLK